MLGRSLRRTVRDRRQVSLGEAGASAVEFALVVPLFLVLVFGTISFGIVFAQELALSNAAREAARYSVVGGHTCAAVQDAARSAARTIAMDGSNVAVTVERVGAAGTATPVCGAGQEAAEPCASSTEGDAIRVRLDYTSQLLIPLVVTDNDFPLEGRGVFRCEYS